MGVSVTDNEAIWGTLALIVLLLAVLVYVVR